MDFYAWRAEAFIQLCDFSSAAQNLRRACSFQPENSKYLERLAFVLYIQVLTSQPGCRSPSSCGVFPCSCDQLCLHGDSLLLCLCPHPLLL